MRTIFTIIILFTTMRYYAQIKYDINFQLEGKTREAIISVPTKLPPVDGWPIVVMLHGTSGDKDVFYNARGWKELGQEENFITVFPSSLRWCYIDEGKAKFNTKFVCGDLTDSLCSSENQNLVDDIAFFRKLIEIIDDTLNVNLNKVFLSGFSNGSVMTNKCAVEAGDLFSATASSSGLLHLLDSITPQKRVPNWLILGTKDDRFFSPNFPTELPYGDDSILLYLNKSIKRILACQGLTDNFSKIETAINKSYIWKECETNIDCAPFLFTINKNQTHVYPNGINYPFNSPKLFWEFFNNPPETTTTSVSDVLKGETCNIFPNPANDKIYLNHEPTDYEILNLYGHVMALGKDLSVDVSQYKNGIYFIKMKKCVLKFIVQH